MKRHEEARRQFIQGLRAVAAFYESNPDAYYDGMTVSLSMYAGGRAAAEILDAVAEVFGESEQLCQQNHRVVAKKFSENVKVEVFCPRC